RREVIETDHGMTATEKRISQITAYEASRARDKCSQSNSFRIGRSVLAELASEDLPDCLWETVHMFYNYACKSGLSSRANKSCLSINPGKRPIVYLLQVQVERLPQEPQPPPQVETSGRAGAV